MAEERRGSRDDVALVYGLPTSGILFAMKPSVYVETSVISYLAVSYTHLTLPTNREV